MENEDIERLRGEIAALRAEIAQVAQAVTILADEQAGSASDGGDEDSWQDVVPVIGGGCSLLGNKTGSEEIDGDAVFASAYDANVEVLTTKGPDGAPGTITIGVYWK